MDNARPRFANVIALWAVLALALVPTAGRLWSGTQGAGAPHASHGERHRDTHAHTDAHAGSADVGDDDDCDYCALAAGLLPVAAATSSVPAHAPNQRHAFADAARRHAAASISGLGARGPPRSA